MSNINVGNQSITFQYYQEAKARSFNELLYKVVPQGILDGGEISIISDTVVSLDKFNLMLEVSTDTNDIGIKICTRETIQLSPTEENCYIVGEYDWLDYKDNYMDIKCIRKSAILSKHIVFGKIEYINGVPQSIDYTERTLSKLYHATHNVYSNFLVTTDGLSKNIIVKKGRAFIGGKLVSTSGDYIINNIFEEVNHGMIIKVYIGQDGVPNCVQGEDSVDYIEPNIPNNTLLLSIIKIPPESSVILGDYITQITDFDINTPFINVDNELNKDSTNSLQNSTITEKFELFESYMQDDKSTDNKLTTKNYVDSEINSVKTYTDTNIISKLGQSNGIATLDENKRIPYSQLPESAMEFKGTWDASTNTPTLSDNIGTKGDMYIVSVSGAQDLGSGKISFLVNDRVIYDGTLWEKISSDTVKTVNGQSPNSSGNIELYGTDIKISETDNINFSDKLEQIKKEYINLTGSKMLGRCWNDTNITRGNWTSFVYANGIWVSGSWGSLGIKYSLDGKTWNDTNVTSGDWYKPVYANGIWVIGSGSNSGIKYSLDGKTWNDTNVTDGRWESFVYANGIWVISSRVMYTNLGIKYSLDGKTWNDTNVTDGKWSKAVYANGIWVCGGQGIKYSLDGKTWEDSNVTSGSWTSFVYANGIWVVGAGSSSSTSGIKYSLDGKTWNDTNVTDGKWNTPTYANGIWVVGCSDSWGSLGIKYSLDGKTWNDTNVTDGKWSKSVYANGIWVIGRNRDISEPEFIKYGIKYSLDGKTWNDTNVTDGRWESFVYANGIWVSNSWGSLGIKYSLDGKTWEDSNVTSGNWNEPVYANGIWICPNSSSIKYSSVQDLIDNGWLIL